MLPPRLRIKRCADAVFIAFFAAAEPPRERERRHDRNKEHDTKHDCADRQGSHVTSPSKIDAHRIAPSVAFSIALADATDAVPKRSIRESCEIDSPDARLRASRVWPLAIRHARRVFVSMGRHLHTAKTGATHFFPRGANYVLRRFSRHANIIPVAALATGLGAAEMPDYVILSRRQNGGLESVMQYAKTPGEALLDVGGADSCGVFKVYWHLRGAYEMKDVTMEAVNEILAIAVKTALASERDLCTRAELGRLGMWKFCVAALGMKRVRKICDDLDDEHADHAAIDREQLLTSREVR